MLSTPDTFPASCSNTSCSMENCRWGWGIPACAQTPLEIQQQGQPCSLASPGQGHLVWGSQGCDKDLEPLGTQNKPQLPMWDPGRAGGSGVWGPTALPCLQLLFL